MMLLGQKQMLKAVNKGHICKSRTDVLLLECLKRPCKPEVCQATAGLINCHFNDPCYRNIRHPEHFARE